MRKISNNKFTINLHSMSLGSALDFFSLYDLILYSFDWIGFRVSKDSIIVIKRVFLIAMQEASLIMSASGFHFSHLKQIQQFIKLNYISSKVSTVRTKGNSIKVFMFFISEKMHKFQAHLHVNKDVLCSAERMKSTVKCNFLYAASFDFNVFSLRDKGNL